MVGSLSQRCQTEFWNHLLLGLSDNGTRYFLWWTALRFIGPVWLLHTFGPNCSMVDNWHQGLFFKCPCLILSCLFLQHFHSWKSRFHLWPVISDHRLLNFNFTWQLGKTHRPGVRDMYWDILKMSKLMHQIQGCHLNLKYVFQRRGSFKRPELATDQCDAIPCSNSEYNNCHNSFHAHKDKFCLDNARNIL